MSCYIVKVTLLSCITSCSFFRLLLDLVGALQPQPLSLSLYLSTCKRQQQQPIPLPSQQHITHTPQSVDQSIM